MRFRIVGGTDHAAASESSDNTCSTSSRAGPRGGAPASQRESVPWSIPSRLAKAIWLSPTRKRVALMSAPEIMSSVCRTHTDSQCLTHNAICQNLGMTSPNERLQEARLKFFERPVDAARAMGLRPQTYYAHENGSNGLRPAVARKYASRFKVNVDWLLYNEGPRDRATSALDGLEELSPDDQKLVADFVEFLLTRHQKQKRSA